MNEVASPAPAHFARDCAVTRAAFILLGFLIALEVLMGVAAAVGTWLEFSVARQRGPERLRLEKVEAEFK